MKEHQCMFAFELGVRTPFSLCPVFGCSYRVLVLMKMDDARPNDQLPVTPQVLPVNQSNIECTMYVVQ